MMAYGCLSLLDMATWLIGVIHFGSEMFPSSTHHTTAASVAEGSNLSSRRDMLPALDLQSAGKPPLIAKGRVRCSAGA